MSAEQAPRVQLVTVTVDGLAQLVQWVAAGDTFDERERRATLARHAVDELLARVDHAQMNEQIRSVRQSDHDPWAWPQNVISRN